MGAVQPGRPIRTRNTSARMANTSIRNRLLRRTCRSAARTPGRHSAGLCRLRPPHNVPNGSGGALSDVNLGKAGALIIGGKDRNEQRQKHHDIHDDDDPLDGCAEAADLEGDTSRCRGDGPGCQRRWHPVARRTTPTTRSPKAFASGAGVEPFRRAHASELPVCCQPGVKEHYT